MEQEINLAMAEYVRTGVSRVPKWKFYEAYDARRLGKNAWRDLKERITDRGGSWQAARVIETESDYVFVNSGLGTTLADKI